MDRNYAQYLLDKTRRDYNQIAESFSRTRGKIWEELKILEDYVAEDERVLDLGCGNGRLYELLRKKSADYYGVDASEKLIAIAKQRYPNAKFRVADALNLPFLDNFFDKIISIAVLHHIPSQELRLQFLKEANRVLKPKGLFFLMIWNLTGFKKSLIFLKYALLKILKKSSLDFGDALIPWGGETLRYVHRFTIKDLKKIVRMAGFRVKEIKILERPVTKESNILLIMQKPL